MEFLSTKFVMDYVTANPKPLNELGEFTYMRTYSRWLEEKDRREYWHETVKRAIEYNMSLEYAHMFKQNLKPDIKRMVEEAKAIFKNIYNAKQFPSGRTLWIGNGNPKVNKDFTLGNFNCSFTNIETWDDLSELFYLLMVGVGAGFKSTKRMAANMPKIRTNTTLLHSDYNPVPADQRLEDTKVVEMDNGFAKIYIGDSKNGWVNALKEYFELLTNPSNGHIHTIKISYNSVRPKGEKLKTFGGTASGYEPLLEMFTGIDDVLKNKIDHHLAPIELDENGYGQVRPIHILDIANLIGNNVVVGGVRRCLPEGSLVHTEKGLVKIQNIKVGDKVLISNGYSEVTDWVEQGVQEVVEIQHQNGVFKCTPKHKMAVMTEPNEYEWKMAKDLKQGDRLVFVDDVIEGQHTDFPDTNSDLIIPSLDNDLAWLIGYIHGNGYVDIKGGRVSLSVPSNQPSILEKALDLLQKLSGTFANHKPVDGNYHVIEVGNAKLARYMYEHIKQANKSMDVPEFILEGSVSIRENYLAGLYDADGTVTNKPIVAVVSVYPDFMRQVQAVYHSLGILTRLRLRREAKDNWQTLYELNVVGENPKIKFVEMMTRLNAKLDSSNDKTNRSQHSNGYPREWVVGKVKGYNKQWSSSCKQMTVETYERVTGDKQHLIPVEVKGVVYTRELVQTYDISVDSVHEFVCEGILTHNTAELFLFDADDYESMFAKYGMNGIWTEEQLVQHHKVSAMLEAHGIKPVWFDELGIGKRRGGIDHRRMSNNSIAFSEKPEKAFLDLVFEMMQLEGEPKHNWAR